MKPRPKIQAKMTIWKTAQFFYLIFVWELILDTHRGPGCAQFMWSIFFNRRWLLEQGEKADPAVEESCLMDVADDDSVAITSTEKEQDDKADSPILSLMMVQS